MPDTILPNTLLYSSSALDRAAHHRTDATWIGGARATSGARFVVHWHGKLLIETEPSPHAVLDVRPRDASLPASFLGLLHGSPVFAVDLSDEDSPLNALIGAHGDFLELRGLTATLPEDEAGLLATARGLLYWQTRARFCGICGGACIAERAGHAMRCTQCGAEHFPRTDPAVIMLIERGERVLLGQSHKFPVERNFFSTLAGFVEPGESLEDAVRREVAEEVGVRIGAVRYLGSQPWPFPASLMLGFRAEATTEDIVLDVEEMRAARWFSRADIENRKSAGFNLPPRDSIARRLIEDWMAEG
ncbi:NAD(+) diphosphatase [Acidiphilium sp. AL]|uniref:NAD(+) diphosphatase n=1 Tax=Acidiphilium iwatense TaxID=768198 RepID=A0ABS9DVC1_9PROT|nr:MULTISPECIES: NAD(+) diphosphatase [Acidiphilium]MCF3946083.1 NAD(+) diphosphatase [Acidiphilium iwatense]MCU4162073.1 NAD(+) diphosphatase [Acidiphilium sp. AL]